MTDRSCGSYPARVSDLACNHVSGVISPTTHHTTPPPHHYHDNIMNIITTRFKGATQGSRFLHAPPSGDLATSTISRIVIRHGDLIDCFAVWTCPLCTVRVLSPLTPPPGGILVESWEGSRPRRKRRRQHRDRVRRRRIHHADRRVCLAARYHPADIDHKQTCVSWSVVNTALLTVAGV